MGESSRCQQCDAPLTGQAVRGLCAGCLLKLALEPPAEPTMMADEESVRTAIEPTAPREAVGSRIGRYKLLQEIGEGGFGIVYLADQMEPVKRHVALKVLKPGMDTREVVARFEAESQSLALMDHPNIARIFDGGATESGRPYFVMELVKGVPLTKYCDDQQLNSRQRLDLFLDVLAAVQHAHQKGIIHRDLKPSNILVSPHDGRPVIKVIDFGIAKAISLELTDKTLFTAQGRMIGTPQYMSPEQAEINALDVDTRSDIYSLGVVLYELLTGRTPLDAKKLRAAAYAEIQRLIREEEPPRPSTRISTLGAALPVIARHRSTEPLKLGKQVRGDLDWMVMKAIDKDRARRYETVNGLALDIKRFLADEPVSATPPSAAYRFRKFARRNKTALRVGAGIAVVLIGATIVTTWQAGRATKANDRLVEVAAERDQKEQARKEAEEISAFLGEALQSPDSSRDGRTLTVAEALDRATKKLETDLASQPGRRVKLQAALGHTYQALGLIDRAIPLQEKVRDYVFAAVGPEHPVTLMATQSLANSYHHAGRRDEAIKLQEEVLPLSRKVNGPEHVNTLSTMNNLANSYHGAGRQEEALKLREEVLILRRKVNAPEHPDTLDTMTSLAISYGAAGHWDKALEMRKEALPLSRNVKSPEHPDTLMAMTNLAEAYAAAGHLGEAIKFQEQSLAIKRRVLTRNHPFLIAALKNMANLYELDDRKAAAMKLQAELEALRRLTPPVVQATLVAPDSVWKWLHPTDGKDPAEKLPDFHTTFFLPDFDDSSWKTGKDSEDPHSGFGYGRLFRGMDIGTPENEAHRRTAYFRLTFKTGIEHTNLELRCRRDDGIIVYLDGKEIFRDNVPHRKEAYLLPSGIQMLPENDLVVYSYPIPNTLPAGIHTIAISVHNTALPSSDLFLGGVTLVAIEPEESLRPVIPPRPEQAAPAHLDLSLFYNSRLDKDWHFVKSRPGNNLTNLPTGLQVFDHVQFDVRGLIQLYSPGLFDFDNPRYPSFVRGIKIGRSCGKLHFLFGLLWEEQEGIIVARHRAHFVDGTTVDIPVTYGTNARGWKVHPGANEPAEPPAAWSGPVPRDKGRPGYARRVYHQAWDNPHPQVPIESIELVSTMTNCAPFILAITVE